jgi:membrane-bound ClpP family serine protease
MPNWREISARFGGFPTPELVIPSEYIEKLTYITGRHTIIYYSDFLEPTPGVPGEAYSITDSDMNAFMATVHKLDSTKGLDLILHTPGGRVSATEAIVRYLKCKFDHIRVIVPHLAMSAGTMIALSANKVLLAKHASLGAIDPQIANRSAHAFVEEFELAVEAIRNNEPSALLYRDMVARHPVAFIEDCRRAIKWSEELVTEWLTDRMFSHLSRSQAKRRAKKIVDALGDHDRTRAHDRHVNFESARKMGIEMELIENIGADPQLLLDAQLDDFQDGVLSIHHAMMNLLARTSVVKIVQNDLGVRVVQQALPPQRF